MKDRLVAFGWPDDRVIVIDDDLGISGSGSAERPGFRRLLKLVTDQQVGIVLGLEMSRLARNSKDWHDLFEVCAIFHTLIADEDGVFDPQDPNDRLVLGLKGIIAEMELHTMKVCLERGRLNKAQRGELFHDVPVGYVLDEKGLPQLDPDESVRHVMKLFFDLFESLGSAHALFHYLAEQNIRLPFRKNQRDRSSHIDWRLPGKTTVYELIKHPLYAGAYSYGRRKKVDLAERRFKHVDPANRLVAGRLECEWEAALAELEVATSELDQLRSSQPVKLSDIERQELRKACADIASLWRERATVEERKQIVRLLLRRVEVEVHNNTERVSIRLHWSGGFESSHQITRTVMQFHQLEAYEQLIDRVLELTLSIWPRRWNMSSWRHRREFT